MNKASDFGLKLMFDQQMFALIYFKGRDYGNKTALYLIERDRWENAGEDDVLCLYHTLIEPDGTVKAFTPKGEMEQFNCFTPYPLKRDYIEIIP
ncbi:MAG: hypothetical protein PHF25_08150 [Candidatus Margulisbacteria bacterium]|nr:hypothetical protein [Candidatus Margulisiibacteriota bacterium]